MQRDKNGKAKFFWGVNWDVSKEYQQQEELKQKTSLLIEASKMAALGEMAGGIGHEVNNPLVIIKMRAEKLHRELLKNPEVFESSLKDLQKISETVDRIAKIVKGLKQFSRQADADPFEIVPFSNIVQDTISLCEEKFSSHGIKVIYDKNFDLELECKATQISQVLMNLFTNASDAIQNIESRWIQVTSEKSGEYLRIRVLDSGIGIESKIESKMFQPSYTTKEVGHGTVS